MHQKACKQHKYYSTPQSQYKYGKYKVHNPVTPVSHLLKSVLQFRVRFTRVPSVITEITTYQLLETKAKSRKYQGVFKVKSRVKTWQIRGIWSQQLEHKQVPQWGTEPGVRKGKRSLLACTTRCKCSMETTHNRLRSSSLSRP